MSSVSPVCWVAGSFMASLMNMLTRDRPLWRRLAHRLEDAMRIVSGQYKGKSIAAPEGRGTRPTSDRAREAVFNILEHASWVPDVKGARVLDLFAGSGALGLESLSRGAAFCLFVETDEAARGAIRDN